MRRAALDVWRVACGWGEWGWGWGWSGGVRLGLVGLGLVGLGLEVCAMTLYV